MTGIRVGIDVGGTFTDVVIADTERGSLTVAKVLSTTPDPAEGVLNGFRDAIDRSGFPPQRVVYFAHASTVASNLVVERSGPRIALVTTKGFRDVLHIQRQKRADLYDLFYDKPVPLVARRDIFEATERTLADGEVRTPLVETEARRIVEEITRRGIHSVAVVFLNSYANDQHERRFAEIAADAAPGLVVSLSCVICPHWREYERTSTTAMNAYVSVAVRDYLQSMEDSLSEEGLGVPIHVMQCSGGLATTDGIRAAPVSLIESGPAAGSLVAGVVGEIAGRPRIIAFDMGGTTAKVSIIENGVPALVEDFEVAPTTKLRPGSGLPVSVPAVDLIEVGTGGGSIAHLDLGVLSVGPRSAGASPGPACYGLGGTEPTITDANLALGYLDPTFFLGGDLALDVDAAHAVIEERVAGPLGLSVHEAAYAIHALANASMANSMRVMTVQRGLDPRAFTVVAFGGAAPLHAAAIASDVGVADVIVPANAGVASALGLLAAPVKFEFSQTALLRLEGTNLSRMTSVFDRLEARGLVALKASNATEGSRITRQARMRYAGQGYEISVGVPQGPIDEETLEDLRRCFLETYIALYGYADTDPATPLEIVDLRLTATGPPPQISSRLVGVRSLVSTGPATSDASEAYFPSLGGLTEVQRWHRYTLAVGQEIEGPALIRERESTILVPPLAVAEVDHFGNVVLRLNDTEREPRSSGVSRGVSV